MILPLNLVGGTLIANQELSAQDLMAGGRFGLKGGLCVVVVGGCVLSLINKFLP